MSPSDAAEMGRRFTELARDIAATCNEAVDQFEWDSLSDEALGQILGSIVRLYAAKAQADTAPFPYAGNSGVTPTDACIVATALLDAVGLQAFDLGLWQDMSNIGKLAPRKTGENREERP